MIYAVKFQPADLPMSHAFRAELMALDSLPLDRVREIWDEYDGENSPRGFSGEAVHMELNRRNDGGYCAV